MAHPLALLDEVIGAFEAERQKALPVLARAKGVEAERLFKAVKQLDDKLAEARAKRVELAGRTARVERFNAIVQEARAIRQELQAGEADAARRDYLRKRSAELQEEVRSLKEQSPAGTGAPPGLQGSK